MGAIILVVGCLTGGIENAYVDRIYIYHEFTGCSRSFKTAPAHNAAS